MNAAPPSVFPLHDTGEAAASHKGKRERLVRPDAVPMVGALPGTVTLRKIPPGSTAAQNPEDRIEHLHRITPLAPGSLRGREKVAYRCYCYSWSSCRCVIRAA